MPLHPEPLVSTREFVEWFHHKFRSPYMYNSFTTIKGDHMTLIDLVNRYEYRTFLEIGTWRGYTALLMYLHPRIERVKCIDIHKDMGIGFEHNVCHNLMEKEEYGSFFKNTFVDLVFADTMIYPRGNEQHDLIFIDGNHDYAHVKNDTELALSMKPKLIVWHDYNSIGNDDVQKYINELVGFGSEMFVFPNSSCVAAKPENITTQKGGEK